MTKLMNRQGVLDLAKGLIEEHPDNLNTPDNFLAHLGKSYDNAGQVVEDACSKYLNLKNFLSEEETALAAGLHDIGRPFNQNQLFHELSGRRYIQNNGLKLGVADNQLDVCRIVQMFTPHFLVLEQWGLEENAGKREQFQPLSFKSLIPKTLQQLIVVYAELTNGGEDQISFEGGIEDIKRRYVPGSEWARSNPSLASAMKIGLTRVSEVCENVQRLRGGKLSEREISQFGFN